MYTFHIDETGRSGNTKFFYIGGLVAHEDQFIQAVKGVGDIRDQYGYEDTDLFKFSTNTRPHKMDRHKWTSSKSDALRLIDQLGIKFVATYISHEVARPLERAQGTIWNLQNLMRHYARLYLRDTPGAVCMDRIDEKWGNDEIAKIAQHRIEYKDSYIGIPEIIHFAFTDARFSKFNSLVDIALGSFQLCCENAFKEPTYHREQTTQTLLEFLAPIFAKDTETGYIKGAGAYPQPSTIKAPNIKKEYDELSSYIVRHMPRR